MANAVGYTQADIDDLVNKVHAGAITPTNLPRNLYLGLSSRLIANVFDGFGDSLDSLDDRSREFAKIADFHKNVQVFSAAKTHQQVVDMTRVIFDEEGLRRSLSEFRKLASGIFNVYNDAWLKTELATATNVAFGSRQWLDVSADAEALPLLQYQTVGDERVRAAHVELDHIVKPVNDPFWNVFFPPNGWNCRCTVTQLEEGEKTVSPLTVDDLKQDDQLPSKLFDRNPGKTKFIFDETGADMHPYFNVDRRFEVLKDNNFNLPLNDRTAGN